MKRILLSIALSLLAFVSARADLIFYDGFDYANGPIIVVSTNLAGTTTNWFHTGTATAADGIVNNHKVEVSATGGATVSRSEDFNRPFTSNTNGGPFIIYSSFTVNCTNLPPATGTYFAHLIVSGNTFHCRVFAQAGTLPGTWRLGAAAGSGTVSKVFPANLTTNVDYQVVVKWDPTGFNAATLWVNPISESDPSVITSDTLTGSAGTITAFGFRQASSFGNFFCTVSNLAVATSFDEAATNVWTTNAVTPLTLRSPSTGTNFTGATFSLVGLATGQGLGNLTYQWQKNGTDYPNPDGNTNVLTFIGAAVPDTGNYRLITTTPYGLSTTSAVASIWVTNAPVPPTIVTQPTNTSVYFGQTASLSVGVTGPGNITYTWSYNGGALGPNVTGDGTPTLTITDVQTNNGTTGTYRCGVSNEFGGILTSNAVLTATPVPTVPIAFLRTLVDPVNYVATNSTQLWKAVGTVTTYTNLTTGNTASYYMQDSTAGINIFATFGSTFRPQQGDVVAFVGVLSSFNSTLELLADTVGNPLTSYTVLSNNLNLLPAPKTIPFGVTNNLAQAEALEGSLVMLTNVSFGASAGNVISTLANTTVVVTNAAGEPFNVFFSAQDLDTANQTLPASAVTLVGPLTQNLPNGTSPRNQGYSVTVTRFSDIVTNPLTLSIVRSGVTNSLAWSAAPYSYTYNVLTSTNVAGPYAPENQQYQAIMLGSSEVPTNGSTASGYSTVVLSADQTQITVNMNFTGLTGGNATAAHIHGPAGAGTNASVIFPLSGVPSATSGAIPEQLFSINATQLGYLRAGLLYLNVHNGTFPGGEIRGQLAPVPFRFTTPNGSYDDASAGTAKYYLLSTP